MVPGFLIAVRFDSRFDKREEAQEAIARLHGTIPEGGSEPLSVKIAEEHGKQKAAYYAGWQAGYNQSRGKWFYARTQRLIERPYLVTTWQW